MKIYWAPIDSNPDFSLSYEIPDRLPKTIPEHLKGTDYFRCPAFNENIKNIFALRSPVDVDIEFEDGNLKYCSNDAFVNKIFPPQGNVVQFKINNLFITDKSCKIKMMHPFLHTNDFVKNGNTVYGEYDIGKWFRPLQAAFIVHRNTMSYKIRKGDIFAYVQFDTDEPVELVPFDVTPNIERILQKCLDMKFATFAPISLDKCYKSFIMYRYSKAIIKEIRANENTSNLVYPQS